MTTRGRKRRIARASCSRVAGVFTMPASGRPRFSRAATPSTSAARSASAARSSADAARAHLALREIENRRALPGARRLDERAAARELDVVAVRGDGEQVEGPELAMGEYTRSLIARL